MRPGVDPALLHHDLRAPLRSIDALVDFVAEDVHELRIDAVDGHLDRIRASVAGLRGLVDDLRRLDDAMEAKPVETRKIASLVEDALRPVEVPEGITITVDIDHLGTQEIALATRPFIECMTEVVRNAVIHRKQSSGTVRISGERTDDWLSLRITDDAAGIATEHRDVIFEPLCKVAIDRDHKGVGLGLAIARRLAEIHGATLELESTSPSGSTFCIRWPTAARANRLRRGGQSTGEETDGPELAAANQNLQSILDNVGVPMLVVDRQRRITHVSAASTTLFGISTDRDLPHLSAVRAPIGFPNLSDAVERAIQYHDRLDVRVQSGVRHAIVSVVPHFDRAGDVVGAIILVIDSTEALRESNIQLKAAVDLAGIGCWTRNLDSESFRMVEGYFQLLGGDPELEFEPTMSISRIHEMLLPESRRRYVADLDRLVETGERFETELDLVGLDGETKTLRVRVSPNFGSGGEDLGILGVGMDITKQKQREKQLEGALEELSRSNEELNRFSYVCSHDLKEPVRMIESLCGLLLDEGVMADETQRSAILGRITGNMSRLRRTIDSLLAYSRIDAKVEETEIDLRDVVAEMDDSLSLSMSEHGAVLIVDELPHIVGARIHFVQLFQNLVGNALKFSDKDETIVRISSTEDPESIHLWIEDNGPGVPDEARERIFSLFDRLHRHDQVEGVGLGLSICERIVEQYGGTIRCTDSDLGGARFEIELPSRRKVTS